MKLFKKFIVGAILGLSLCVGLFFTNNIKPKATAVVINPITSLDDIPLGAVIQWNSYITWSGNGTTLQGEIYNGNEVICTTANNKNIIKIVFQNNSMTYYYNDGTNQFAVVNHSNWNSGTQTLTVVNNLYYHIDSSTTDNSASFIVNAFNNNSTITYETTTPTTINLTLNGNGGVHESGTGELKPIITLNDLTIGDIATIINNTNSSWLHTGYILVGWNTTTTATTALSNNELNAIQNSTTLYAVWRSNTTIQVSFQVNAPSGTTATGSVPSSEYVEQNSVYTLPGNTGNLAIEHYNFIGWNTYPGANNGLTTYETGRQNVIFFAIWQIEQKTLTLNLQGGSITGGTTRTYDYNTQVNLNTLGTPQKVGFIFLGWGLTADATSYISTITMTTNKNIYAIWGTATNDLATITYYPNGATSGYVPSSQQVVKGTQYNVEGNPGNLEREGYTFIGWGTTADATTPITTLYPNANVSLYAIWSQLQYSTGNIYINNVLICELRIYNGNETTFTTGFYNFGANYFTITLSPQNGIEVVDYNSNYIWSIVDGYITYTFNGEYFMNITIQSTRNNYVETLTKTQMQPIYTNNTPYENGGTINYYITIDGANDDIDNFRNVVGNIFNSVQTLLNVQIGWFSMGSIIAIVLAIGVMFFIFKIARGGGNS